MLVVTWPLLGSLRLSNSTIMITTEVARILKVFQMLWEEVRINHSKLSKSITLLQVESMAPQLWIAGLVPVPTSAWWATQCTWQTDWSGTISGIIRWGHRWTIHTRLTLFIQVQLVVTLLPTNAKDDLAQFSNSKFIGSYQLQLDGERELQGYTVRTLKV